MSDDEYDEDDIDLMVDFEKHAANKEEIKVRVDQYLTASKLGRMAFVAGDIQLAKDRFNLAMSLEMQTEFENNVDFGVTGGLLRDELLSRCGNDQSLDRFGCVLSRFLQVFEHADAMVGKHPKQPKWYSTMASCLCVVNEWDKAEIVYKEGLKHCPGNKDLMKSLQCLQKTNETIADLMGKAGFEKPSLNQKRESTSSFIGAGDDVADIDYLPEPKLRPINKMEKKRYGSLPGSKPSDPPLRKMSNSWLPRQSGQRLRSKSLVHTKQKQSSSSKRLSQSGIWNEHIGWKSSFSPIIQSEKLDQGFSSRTLRTMRTINSSSDIDATLIPLLEDTV